jgi:hypothetical protein
MKIKRVPLLESIDVSEKKEWKYTIDLSEDFLELSYTTDSMDEFPNLKDTDRDKIKEVVTSIVGKLGAAVQDEGLEKAIGGDNANDLQSVVDEMEQLQKLDDTKFVKQWKSAWEELYNWADENGVWVEFDKQEVKEDKETGAERLKKKGLAVGDHVRTGASVGKITGLDKRNRNRVMVQFIDSWKPNGPGGEDMGMGGKMRKTTISTSIDNLKKTDEPIGHDDDKKAGRLVEQTNSIQESHMSNIDIMRQESEDFDDFKSKVRGEYGDNTPDDKYLKKLWGIGKKYDKADKVKEESEPGVDNDRMLEEEAEFKSAYNSMSPANRVKNFGLMGLTLKDAEKYVRWTGVDCLPIAMKDKIRKGMGSDYTQADLKAYYDKKNTSEAKNKTYHFHSSEERGTVQIYVTDSKNKTVWEETADGENPQVVEDGFMKTIDDMDGLEEYLKSIKIIPHDSMMVQESLIAEGVEYDAVQEGDKIMIEKGGKKLTVTVKKKTDTKGVQKFFWSHESGSMGSVGPAAVIQHLKTGKKSAGRPKEDENLYGNHLTTICNGLKKFVDKDEKLREGIAKAYNKHISLDTEEETNITKTDAIDYLDAILESLKLKEFNLTELKDLWLMLFKFAVVHNIVYK